MKWKVFKICILLFNKYTNKISKTYIGSYAITVEDLAFNVVERILVDSGTGNPFSNVGSKVIQSSWTNGDLSTSLTGNRTVEIIRPMNDINSFDFTDFLNCANGFGTSLNAISAVGNGAQTVGYHGYRDFADLVNDCCTVSPPTTADPTTADPTTQQPTTTAPITKSPTPSSYTTVEPTTSNPTTNNPTTSIPSVSSTMLQPTKDYCRFKGIDIILKIIQYLQSEGWEITLKQLFVTAFKRTILLYFSDWNDNWCVVINNIQYTLIDGNRRVLLQTNDIDVSTTFAFNEALYEDFFVDDYNSTEFRIEFIRILLSLIGVDDIDVIDIDNKPYDIATDTTTAPQPTYAPHILVTRKSDHNRETTIIILCIVFGFICCFVICYTFRLFYKHEIDYDLKGYAHVNQPNTPNTPNRTHPTTIEMEQTNGKHTNKEGELSPTNALDKPDPMDRQTSFELHLATKLVEEDSLMTNIINEMQIAEPIIDLDVDAEPENPETAGID